MAQQPLVLVSESLPAPWLSALEPHAQVHTGLHIDAAQAQRVSALLTMLTVRVDADLLARFPNLRLVANMAVGFDNVDVAACTRRGVRVSNTPGVLTDATADLAMGLVLAAARGFEAARRDATEGRWGPWSPTGWLGLELRGAMLGVVGLGAIGSAVARRARAFGMRIAYAGPSRKPALEAAFDAEYLDIDALARRADVLSLHCPLNAQTRGLVGADLLSKMPSHAVLVNSARGPIVDSAALVEALQSRSIAGAALDVTDPEPLPPTHPLYALPNCLVLPHLGSATTRTRKAMATLACQNIAAVLGGGEPVTPVAPQGMD